MSAYQGKEECTDSSCLRSPDGTCHGWHCVHCHGRSNTMGHCPARCAGAVAEHEEFEQLVADLKSGKLKLP